MKGAGVRLLWPALAREHHPPLPVTTFSSPQKNGYMGNHAHPIRHLITQAHSIERATHDTAQSSLKQHHPTSPASPSPLPELRKKSVAKSDTFCSKSIACQSFAPYRTSSHQFAGPKKNLSQNRTHFAQNLSHAATFFPLRVKKIYESLPTCRPLAIMLVSVMWTTKGAAKTHARARSYRSYVRASTAS